MHLREVTALWEDKFCLLAGQKRIGDDYKDPAVLKADMTFMMKAIEEYLSSYHGVMRAPLA